jgi:hypothetical protein
MVHRLSGGDSHLRCLIPPPAWRSFQAASSSKHPDLKSSIRLLPVGELPDRPDGFLWVWRELTGCD